MADCLFCKIASGAVASTKVYEDSSFIAFFDLYPANKGHLLIAPKRHSESLLELTEEESAGIMMLAQRIAQAFVKALGCPGVNVLNNSGAAAGQLIFHTHVHVIPRYSNDGLELKWPRRLYDDGEMETLRQKIAPLL